MNTKVRWADSDDAEVLIELSLKTTRASYSSFLGEATVEAFILTGAVEAFVRENIDRHI